MYTVPEIYEDRFKWYYVFIGHIRMESYHALLLHSKSVIFLQQNTYPTKHTWYIYSCGFNQTCLLGSLSKVSIRLTAARDVAFDYFKNIPVYMSYLVKSTTSIL